MSHTPGRKEKDCLNCGTIVQGRYCQNCGQENVVPKETFWHMFTHFFYDITHFDSSFFHTVHHLILKPGFLSKEYMAGRRVSYLHPIRMYVFMSAIFFLIFFSFFQVKDNDHSKKEFLNAKERIAYQKRIENALKKDSGDVKLLIALAKAKDTAVGLSVKDVIDFEERKEGGVKVSFGEGKFKTFAAYDSAEKKLPPKERDGWLVRQFVKKGIEINNRFEDNPNEAFIKLLENLFHRLPYMLFISLPLFALILKLIYVRRKQFYYADHGVFTIHLYVFTFILLLLVFSIGKLQEKTGWDDLDWVMVISILGLFFYLYKAMRNFYGQRRGKTFLKFLLVTFWSLVMMAVLFAIFFFFSVFTF